MMTRSDLRLAAYGLPAVALAALYLPLFTYVTPFYAQERGVDIGALGLVWIAIRMFDAVSDPGMGWLSDRTRTRWGRRRIWLVAAVPLTCLATWQVFVPPEDAGLGHAGLWLFLLTLGWTMAQTPYAAWGAELDDSYLGRARVTAWREGLVLVGTLLATVLYFAGGEGGGGLATIAVLVVILLPLSVGLAVATVGERPQTRDRRLTLSEGWAALRDNRPFRVLLLAWFVNGAANALPATLFLFFIEHVLQAPEHTGPLVLAYFVSAIAGVPLWTWVAGRWSKHRAWGTAMIYVCAVFASALLLGPGDVLAFGVICVLTGLALGADLSLPPAIQADVVELDSRRTGAARAGLFFAIWQVATKAALALSSGLALVTLGGAGFDAAADVNTAAAVTTLAVLYAAVPVVLKLIAVAMMWNFPLTRAEVEGAPA